MCRKLETEEEKVLPFYASTLTEQEEKEIESMVQQEPENELANVRNLVVFVILNVSVVFYIEIHTNINNAPTIRI